MINLLGKFFFSITDNNCIDSIEQSTRLTMKKDMQQLHNLKLQMQEEHSHGM